jgi:hypothetical protein
MPTALIYVCDVVAMAALGTIYFTRHHRRDMVLAYVGLHAGVLAAATALDRGAAGAGLGLGLFGVLSIIRLRSFELTHEEVAYYFAALTLGLLGGVTIDPSWAGVALMGAIVVTIFVVDHPQLLSDYRHQVLTLDAAYTDEDELRARLASLLGAEVKQLRVRKLDLVHDMTIVDVRYRVLPGAGVRPGASSRFTAGASTGDTDIR